MGRCRPAGIYSRECSGHTDSPFWVFSHQDAGVLLSQTDTPQGCAQAPACLISPLLFSLISCFFFFPISVLCPPQEQVSGETTPFIQTSVSPPVRGRIMRPLGFKIKRVNVGECLELLDLCQMNKQINKHLTSDAKKPSGLSNSPLRFGLLQINLLRLEHAWKS